MSDVKELIRWLNDYADCDVGIEQHAAMIREAADALQSLTARVAGMEEALSGVLKRIDNPGNDFQVVKYFRRWPEIEAARAALNPVEGE